MATSNAEARGHESLESYLLKMVWSAVDLLNQGDNEVPMSRSKNQVSLAPSLAPRPCPPRRFAHVALPLRSLAFPRTRC